jgi:ATP-binding cassette subfamily F protein 3
VEVDDVDSSAIRFAFPPAPHSGKVVVEARNLTKKYGEKLVLKDLEFIIEKGDFVAFVGRNGEGKTTLSRIITGHLEHDGICKLGHNVVIGYYAQNQAELLDPDRTVFQTIDDVAVGDMRPKVRGILGSFLFGTDAIEKKVKVLSGGEKARLALAKLLLKPVNLLVLDEPTNHLDMVSKDILKNALLKFDGTLIVVSHDRDFLQGLTDKVIEFKNHGIRTWLGDVVEFLQARKLATLAQLEARKAGSRLAEGNDSSENKINYERRKQLEREVRRVASKVQRIEEEIEGIEKEILKFDAILSNPENHKNAAKSAQLFKEYQQLKDSLEVKMEAWEVLHEEMEKMAAGENNA